MHPDVRSAAEAGRNYVLVAEPFPFRDIDLYKLAFMHGQLDGAETQLCKGVKHRANWFGKGKCARFGGRIFIRISHKHPYLDGPSWPLIRSAALNSTKFVDNVIRCHNFLCAPKGSLCAPCGWIIRLPLAIAQRRHCLTGESSPAGPQSCPGPEASVLGCGNYLPQRNSCIFHGHSGWHKARAPATRA